MEKRGFIFPSIGKTNFRFQLFGVALYSPTVSPQKYLNTFYRYVVLAVVLLALIGVVFSFLPKIHQFQGYQDTKTGLKDDIRTKEAHIKELRLNQHQFSTDKHCVQELAREKGCAQDGETSYQLEESAATNREIRSTK